MVKKIYRRVKVELKQIIEGSKLTYLFECLFDSKTMNTSQ